MNPVELIERKRDGDALTQAEYGKLHQRLPGR